MINAFDVVEIVVDIIALLLSTGLFIIAFLSYLNKKK